MSQYTIQDSMVKYEGPRYQIGDDVPEFIKNSIQAALPEGVECEIEFVDNYSPYGAGLGVTLTADSQEAIDKADKILSNMTVFQTGTSLEYLEQEFTSQITSLRVGFSMGQIPSPERFRDDRVNATQKQILGQYSKDINNLMYGLEALGVDKQSLVDRLNGVSKYGQEVSDLLLEQPSQTLNTERDLSKRVREPDKVKAKPEIEYDEQDIQQIAEQRRQERVNSHRDLVISQFRNAVVKYILSEAGDDFEWLAQRYHRQHIKKRLGKQQLTEIAGDALDATGKYNDLNETEKLAIIEDLYAALDAYVPTQTKEQLGDPHERLEDRIEKLENGVSDRQQPEQPTQNKSKGMAIGD